MMVQFKKKKKKKIHGSGTTVMFSNEELNNITDAAKALEDFDVLMKGVTEILKNEIKKLHSGN